MRVNTERYSSPTYLLPLLRTTLLLLLLATATSLTLAQSESENNVPPLKLPQLKPLPQHSFRGPVAQDAKIKGFEVTGQATRIATSPDFLRLVPSIPLAFGGVFTTDKFKSREWIVEIAMRVHGSVRTGGTRGGRGLAFWYTKDGSPTPSSSRNADSSKADDSAVSFFGQSQAFDGLGIVFDTSPSAPLIKRSDPAGWQFGADTSGVISALIDDGKTGKNWFDNDYRKDAKRDPAAEAAYLDRAVGECEAAFRNAPGLVWVRISHFDKQIRVDLDLQPHTSLSQEQRHFTHHCFTVQDVELPSGYHFGLTGLASGNTEPDSVDVYAFDAWEVVSGGATVRGGAGGVHPPPIVAGGENTRTPLAGTSSDGDDPASMLHEVLMAQSRMTEALDALSRRMDGVVSGTGAGSSGLESLQAQMNSVQATLANLAGTGQLKKREGEPDVVDLVKQLMTSLEKQHADINALTVRLDGLTVRVNKNLGTISARVSEVFAVVNGHVKSMAKEKELQGSLGYLLGRLVKAASWLGALGLAGALILFARNWIRNRSGGGGGRGKKMI